MRRYARLLGALIMVGVLAGCGPEQTPQSVTEANEPAAETGPPMDYCAVVPKDQVEATLKVTVPQASPMPAGCEYRFGADGAYSLAVFGWKGDGETTYQALRGSAGMTLVTGPWVEGFTYTESGGTITLAFHTDRYAVVTGLSGAKLTAGPPADKLKSLAGAAAAKLAA